MTVKECYERMGANYDEALSRLLDDARIKKYLLKYAENSELGELTRALSNKNYQDAFLHAHNIKGFGLNLSLVKLFVTSDRLCEALRNGVPKEDPEPLFQAVKEAHEDLFAAVNELEKNSE